MTRSRISLILIMILTSSIHAQTASLTSANAITPSQLNSNRDLYDGKLVHVKGYAVVGFERREFYDSESSSRTGDPFKTCITIVNAKNILQNMKKYNNTMLVLTGLFTKDVSKKPYIQMGGCNLTAIDLTDQPQPQILPNKVGR